MTDDAAAVLAAAHVDAAHRVGISMGGLLLVDLCSRHPDLVASLVFIAALSPDAAPGIGDDSSPRSVPSRSKRCCRP
jgi:pimeloyl-ACP methyl ester carboxylesterase